MIYSKLAVLMLNTIAAERPDSTNSVIAEWLLMNQKSIHDIGIKEVAENAHVSMASVSRFVRDLGFLDFSELKDALIEGMNDVEMIPGKEEDLPHACLTKIEQGLQEAASSTSMGQIKNCTRIIQQYDTIWVFSLLKGEAAAISFAADLSMLGKNAKTLFSYKEQMDCMKASTSKELIILFSYTGTYFNYEGRIPSKATIAAPIIMISGGQNHYPDLVSLFIHFNSSLDHSSHPYTLLLLSDIIIQEYIRLQQADAPHQI